MGNIRFELDCDTNTTHFHEELEMLYVLSGQIAVMIADNSFTLGTEDFVVFNSFEHHDLYRYPGSHTVSLYISTSIIQKADLGMIRCCSRIQKEQADYFPLLRAKLALLYGNYTEQTANRELFILGEVFGLLAILKQQFQVSDDDWMKNLLGTDTLRNVLVYISEHFSENITLQSTADAVFLSRGYLSRMFQKQMGVSFPDYLRILRLNKAVRLLLSTNQSITYIALECGFSNTNTFILNFKNIYGETPSTYRKNYPVQNNYNEERFNTDTIPIMNLTKHASYEERFQPLNKKHEKPTCLDINIREDMGELTLRHQDSISVGWAEMLFHENIRNAIRRAVKEIGFRYVTIWGIFDDTVDIYHESNDGRPRFSFTYLDIILDFILSTGAKPSLAFASTPSKLVSHKDNLFGNSCINLPENLGKWEILMESVMRHLVNRYGTEELLGWRYFAPSAFYISYGIFSMEEYLACYECTYTSIRRVLPEACIVGCQLDLDFLKSDGPELLKYFLNYFKQHHCLPDIISFQCFYRDFSKISRMDVTARITAHTEKMAGEPAPCSSDPDLLEHELRLVHSILDSCGLSEKPVQVVMWNSTLWQGDLGNDTCFKAAFLVRNYLKNYHNNVGLNFAGLSDNERKIMNSVSFHGGFGLINYQGIPKASYYAMTLLNKLDKTLLANGDGYTITCSKNRKSIQICLYHYCHYDMEKHINYVLSEDEQRTSDRYYGFENPGIRSFRFFLNGLLKGEYEKHTYMINRAQGSSYDSWINIGSPKVLTQMQREYLERISFPGYQYEQIQVKESGKLLISAVLDVHEVRVICLEKK